MMAVFSSMSGKALPGALHRTIKLVAAVEGHTKDMSLNRCKYVIVGSEYLFDF